MRILCKSYEFSARAYTFICRGLESDKSRVLVDLYTADQSRLQEVLDHGLSDIKREAGDLLVLIPFRDRWELTEQCLSRLSKQIIPPEVKLRTVLINNRSESEETALRLASVSKDFPNLNTVILKADYEFNYSRLNNDGFRQFATPETKWIFFLNNDVELHDQTIIKRMISVLGVLPEAGVVGCSLVYPSRRIQHLFAAPGVKIIAAHPLRGRFLNPKMIWFEKPARVVPAVTGAVMLLRAEDFKKVGMFDESLPSLGQDVILCLEVWQKLGKCAVSVNTGDVIHHESVTKKPAFPRDEIDYVYAKYGKALKEAKLYSHEISRWSEMPVLALPFEPSYPVRWVTRFWRR